MAVTVLDNGIESDILILPGTTLFDACWEALPPPPNKESIKHQTAGEYNYIVRSGNKYNLMGVRAFQRSY